MSRAAAVRHSDVVRYVKAARAAGIVIGRVEIDGGRVTIVPIDAGETEDEAAAVERRMEEAFGK